MKRILSTIIAILFVVLAGTPASASTTIRVNESENSIYSNFATGEVWGAMIFNAGSSHMANDVYTSVDEWFLMDTLGDAVGIVSASKTLTGTNREVLDVSAVKTFTATSADFLTPSIVLVAYEGQYVYTFIGIDYALPNPDFYEWAGEVIAAEGFDNVDAPEGFVKANG